MNSRVSSRLERQVKEFRGGTTRTPVHPTEIALSGVLATELILAPWLLGGMSLWAQCILGLLALSSLVISLIPREYGTGYCGDQAPFRLIMWPKLSKFPIAWFGSYLLGIILVQALNPAYIYCRDASTWWIWPISHMEWLPTGVTAPFAIMNTWRMLIIYSTVLFSVSAAWVGLTRRRSVQAILLAVAINAVSLAVLGILQKAFDATKVLWLIKAPAPYFVATFFYKNHAGAYLNLILGLILGLAAWFYVRGRRRMAKSTPGGLFAFFATVVATLTLMSGSRTAIILLVASLTVAFFVLVLGELRGEEKNSRNIFIVIGLGVGFASFIGLGVFALQSDALVEEMHSLVTRDYAESVSGRQEASSATWQMFRDRPVFGWGAGAFRFEFPRYQLAHPEIREHNGHLLYWEHAHNDYAELCAELGIVGVAAIMASVGYWLALLVRLHVWRSLPCIMIFTGLATTVLHSIVDFNFYSPAILITWCTLAILLVRWREFDESALG